MRRWDVRRPTRSLINAPNRTADLPHGAPELCADRLSMCAVPDELRPAIAEHLARLVRGDLPDLLTWVARYGSGSVLIEQPTEIWTHRESDAIRTEDGGWHVVLPPSTTTESPSDLSAEVRLDAGGTATIEDVHVL